MSNTFLEPGTDDVEEMVGGIERGLLLRHGASGYTMAERGDFTCRADRAIRIERGELGDPVRHVAVSGNVLETLGSIDRVSREFELCDPGYCTKDGQDVTVDNGGPYVRVPVILVGGAEEPAGRQSSRRITGGRK
jgi:TldD protein